MLALGLGKYKGVACAQDPAPADPRFTTLDATRAELRRLIERQHPGVVLILRGSNHLPLICGTSLRSPGVLTAFRWLGLLP